MRGSLSVWFALAGCSGDDASCPTPIGDPAEIAATPRANTNLEQLALWLEPDRLTASQSTYDRVVRDVAAIRATHPEATGVEYYTGDGKTMVADIAAPAAQPINDGQYHDWDCLNAFYGATAIYRDADSVTIRFRGIYNLQQIGALYDLLPGFSHAEPEPVAGDGPTICAHRSDPTFEYVFDHRGGDCPAGCTSFDAYGFATDAAGTITLLGQWDSATGDPRPDWYIRICGR